MPNATRIGHELTEIRDDSPRFARFSLTIVITRKTITCVTCYKRRCWKVLMSNNRWRIIMKFFFFAMRYTLKRLWNESLNAWRFANKPFNQTVMGKQAFVNTCYHQSFMKTNTCPRGKKKLDCITSLDIQYFKKEQERLWLLKSKE